MGATAWRWLKVAVFLWGAVSLLGLAAVFSMVLWEYNSYGSRLDEADAHDPQAERRAQLEERFEALGLGASAIVAIEKQTPGAEWGQLRFDRVRLAPGVASRSLDAGWHAGGQLPPHVAFALDCSRSRAPDWMPAATTLAQGGFRVHADDISFDVGGLTGIDAVVLQPSTGTAWRVHGVGFDPIPFYTTGCRRLS